MQQTRTGCVWNFCCVNRAAGGSAEVMQGVQDVRKAVLAFVGLHACERCSDSGVMAYSWQQVMCGSFVHQAGVAGEGGVWVIQTCFALVGYYLNSCLMRLDRLAGVADW